MTPLFLNIGRIYTKAFMAIIAKIPTGTRTNTVINAFIFIKIIKEIIAVIEPPINWTNPVPTRFRTPSTSFITLDTRAPVLLLSKKFIGSDNNLRCTWERNRYIKCWASTLNKRVSEKEVSDWTKIEEQTIIIKIQSVDTSFEGIMLSINVLLA